MVFKAKLTKKDIKKISADFKEMLAKAGIRVDDLILFGSYAAGRPHAWSDVDLCVVSRQFGKNDFDDMAKLSKIGKQVSYLIEPHPINPKDLKRGIHPLAEEIKRKGRKI